jgi:hypothetical protein
VVYPQQLDQLEVSALLSGLPQWVAGRGRIGSQLWNLLLEEKVEEYVQKAFKVMLEAIIKSGAKVRKQYDWFSSPIRP